MSNLGAGLGKIDWASAVSRSYSAWNSSSAADLAHFRVCFSSSFRT
jgi:hypothetical protein